MNNLKEHILHVMYPNMKHTVLDIGLALMDHSGNYYGLQDVCSTLRTLSNENKIDITVDEKELTVYYCLKQMSNEVSIVEDE